LLKLIRADDMIWVARPYEISGLIVESVAHVQGAAHCLQQLLQSHHVGLDAATKQYRRMLRLAH
jgi:hypothetical protein